MDVLPQLLSPKFPAHTQFDLKRWEGQIQVLVEAFIRKRGMHQDEQDNFNSYLPELLTMVKDHIKPFFIDEHGQLHMIEILEAHFVLPYEDKVGIDSPERALMRNHYEGQVRGIARYSIRRKPAHESNPRPDDDEEEDEEQFEQPVADDREAEVSLSSKDPKESEDNNEEEGDEDEDDEEDEEGDEDEEEEEDEDDEPELDPDADASSSSDEEAPAQPDEESDDDEEEEEDDDDEEDEDEDDENGSSVEKKAAKVASRHDELKPTVGSSRNICLEAKAGDDDDGRPAFLIQKEDFSKYTEVVSEVVDEHMCLDMPSWLRSKLDWMSTPYREPFLQTKPYLLGQTYLVSRTFKLCPYEEYYFNNRVLAMKSDQVEIRSKFYHKSKRFRTNCTLKFDIDYPKFRKTQSWWRPPRFRMQIPHETPKVYCAIMVLAMAYGWSSNFLDAIRMFLRYQITPEMNMFLNIIATDTDECRTQKEAIRRVASCLSKCRRMAVPDEIASYVSFTLRGEFLPNLVNMEGDDNCDHTRENLRKGYALAEVCSELIQLSEAVNERREPQDRWKPVDRRAYHIKRIDTPGEKMVFLTRKFVKHMMKKASKSLETAVTQGKSIDLTQVLNAKMIKLTNSVKNGVWDSKTDASENNQNKTQMAITGYCSDALHSQVQKIIKFAMKKNSNPDPLLTHPTQMGRVDLYLTPESDRCAIVRNKALGCWITPLTDHINMNHLILRVIERHRDKLGWLPLQDTAVFPDRSYTVVKDIYSGVVGWVKQPFELYKIFLGLRRRCAIWPFLGMEWDRRRDIFYFNVDEGRMCRPLIILERLQDLMREMDGPAFLYHPDPVQMLLEQGVVEYLDAAEEYCGLVFTAESLEDAMRGGFLQTHMEVHGLFALSITVAKAFCNFNAGPRRMYTGNMEKRSLGLKLFEDRGTSVSYSLWYAQDPLLSTVIDYALEARHIEPNGINAFVGVLSDESNIEDSYVMCEDSIQMGLGISTETMVVNTALGTNCVFQRPDGRTKGKAAEDKYHAIKPDGSPEERAQIRGGDAYVSKVFFKKEGAEMKRRCVSKFLPWNENYVVRNVSRYPPDTSKPAKIIRTSLTKTNVPTEGDKFFFGHGQKGTISEKRRSWDMPFVESGPMAGRSPDILINSCSFARVTPGFQLEILWGKARAYDATKMYQYRSAFMSQTSFKDQMEMCSAILRLNGLLHTGKERMRRGDTGQLIQCQVYCGFANVRVLKHMARDKLRSRDRGPINEPTRQPTVGKRQSGALRAISGEHENINTYSYGMSAVFKAVNYECADKFLTYWCQKCKMQAVGCRDSSVYFCTSCKSGQHLLRVPMTYISSLVVHELYAAGLGHTIVAEPVPADEIVADDEATFHRFKQLRIKN